MNLHFDLGTLLSTFDIMWRGMLAIFVVLAVIYLLVLLMLKIFGRSPKDRS